MDDSQKLQLNKMIQSNNVEDVTHEIREKRVSKLIKNDIGSFLELEKKYARMKKNQPDTYNTLLKSRCSFLYDNYTDIFNRLVKNELDLNIMWKFLEVLRNIEEGKIDQHEGAYQVGSLLKKIYIDSAVKRGENLDKKHSKKKIKTKNLSWSQYKLKLNNTNSDINQT